LHTNLDMFYVDIFLKIGDCGVGGGGGEVLLYLGKYGRGQKKMGNTETLYIIVELLLITNNYVVSTSVHNRCIPRRVTWMLYVTC
jgi:hypothetical protein